MAELERLKMKLERGKISRREFLSRVSAMGLAATAPALHTSTAHSQATGIWTVPNILRSGGLLDPPC